jgi:hypothetical protein
MPRIREYLSNERAGGAVNYGEATASTFGDGRGLMQLGAGLMDMAEVKAQAQERADVTTSIRLAAELRTQRTVALKEAADGAERSIFSKGGTIGVGDEESETQGGEPSIGYTDFAEKFNADTTDKILALRNQLTTRVGREHYDRSVASLEGEFVERALLTQADLAGKQAKADYLTAVDSTRAALLYDPSQWRSAADQLVTSLEVLPLPAAAKADMARKARVDVARSAAQGYIRQDPQLALMLISNGEFDEYVDADDKYRLMTTAETGIKALEIEERRRQKADADAMKAQQAETQNKFLTAYAEGGLTWDMVRDSNLEPFGEGSKKTFLEMLDRQASGTETLKTDPATYRDLERRVFLPFGNPDKITEPGAIYQHHGQLKPADMDRLVRYATEMRDPAGEKFHADRGEFMKMAYAQFRSKELAAGLPDPMADERAYRFSFALDEAIEDFKKAGKNPRALLDPNSPDYFGRTLTQYIPTAKERLADQAERIKVQWGAQSAAGGTVTTPAQPPAEPLTHGDVRKFEPEPKPQRQKSDTPGAYMSRLNRWLEKHNPDGSVK